MTANNTTGSGWGNLRPAYRLEQPEQFYTDRIILVYDKLFNSKNVCMVTSGFNGEDKAYLLFLNPEDTSQKRNGWDNNFVLWDFQLDRENHDRDIYYALA